LWLIFQLMFAVSSIGSSASTMRPDTFAAACQAMKVRL
jgi:hypothetical protein